MKTVFKSLTALLFIVGITNPIFARTNCKQLEILSWENCESIVGGAYATFAGKFGGNINMEELRTTSEIGIAGCAAGSKIYTYKLILSSRGTTQTFRGKSHVLTEELTQALIALKPGDSFIFSDMKANLPSGGSVDVMGRVFTII